MLHNELSCLHNNILDLGIHLEQFFDVLHNNILSIINELLGYNMVLGVILGDWHSDVRGWFAIVCTTASWAFHYKTLVKGGHETIQSSTVMQHIKYSSVMDA